MLRGTKEVGAGSCGTAWPYGMHSIDCGLGTIVREAVVDDVAACRDSLGVAGVIPFRAEEVSCCNSPWSQGFVRASEYASKENGGRFSDIFRGRVMRRGFQFTIKRLTSKSCLAVCPLRE